MTELTTDKELQEYKKEEKDATMSADRIPRDITFIHLGNGMNLKYDESQKYIRKYRPSLMIVISFILMSFQWDQAKWLRYPNIIFCILVSLLCFILLICAKYRRVHINSNFVNNLNYILGIIHCADLRSRSRFALDVTYYVPTLIILMIFHCCNQIIIWSAYWAWPNDFRYGEYENDDLYKYLLMDISEMSVYCLNALTLIVFGSSYFMVNAEYYQQIKKEKEDLFTRYKHNDEVIKEIDDNIDETLKNWENSKKWKTRKCEIGIIVCIMTVCTLVSNWIKILTTYDGYRYINFKYFIYATFLDLMIVVFASYAIYVYHTLLYHYSFINVIIEEFSISIQCKTLDDLISWWEFRKFYIHCVIDIYVAGCSMFVFCGLFGCMFLIVAIFGDSLPNQKYTLLVLEVIVLIYVTIITFKMITIAVSYHECQLSHIHMINKEQLLFEYKDFVFFKKEKELKKIESYKEQMNAIKGVINRICNDVLENSKALSFLGVRMDSNFILFLRAVVMTVVIAAIAQIISMQ